MPFYQDPKTVRSVMQEVFDRLNATPGASDDFVKHHMVVSLYLDNPKTFIGLDGRQKPVRFAFSPDGVKPDLAIRLDVDLLHEILLGKVRLRDAYFGGQIKIKGSIFKAMKLADLFRQAEKLYPMVLKERGLLPE
jgi:putative sterol carrier protein